MTDSFRVEECDVEVPSQGECSQQRRINQCVILREMPVAEVVSEVLSCKLGVSNKLVSRGKSTP